MGVLSGRSLGDILEASWGLASFVRRSGSNFQVWIGTGGRGGRLGDFAWPFIGHI